MLCDYLGETLAGNYFFNFHRSPPSISFDLHWAATRRASISHGASHPIPPTSSGVRNEMPLEPAASHTWPINKPTMPLSLRLHLSASASLDHVETAFEACSCSSRYVLMSACASAGVNSPLSARGLSFRLGLYKALCRLTSVPFVSSLFKRRVCVSTFATLPLTVLLPFIVRSDASLIEGFCIHTAGRSTVVLRSTDGSCAWTGPNRTMTSTIPTPTSTTFGQAHVMERNTLIEDIPQVSIRQAPFPENAVPSISRIAAE